MNKLEIGPRVEGFLGKDWDTLDIVPRPKLTYLVDKDKPFEKIEDNSYDIVYLSHVLEHVHWYNVVDYLKEIYRILKPNGQVEIWVPDFRKIIDVYLNKEKTDGWKGPAYLSDEDKEHIKQMPEWGQFQWILGRIFAYQDNDSDENLHRGAFDKKHLKDCLEKAGFKNIKKLDKPRGYDHGWINLGIGGEK